MKKLFDISCSYEPSCVPTSLHYDLVFLLKLIADDESVTYEAFKWYGTELGSLEPISVEKFSEHLDYFKSELMSFVSDEVGLIDNLFGRLTNEFRDGKLLSQPPFFRTFDKD